MKILVLVSDYLQNNGKIQLMYVHVRNKFYKRNGLDVTVLNFRAKENYIVDGIKVITYKEYKKNYGSKYDILVCHAANIRNHYIFLKRFESKFKKIIFFFHGHEILRINEVYPKEFDFRSKSGLNSYIQNLYDGLKIWLWSSYYKKLILKSNFVFVSKWIYKRFIENMKIDESIIEGKVSIIYNSVGKIFETKNYNCVDVNSKIYDFISIRGNLDGSKYGVDIINELAKNNPNLKFLLIGKGDFFKYVEKADNIDWLDEVINHEEMINLINSAKCGLLPTRQDTQGVMTCEFATYGIPVITSDIEICHEIFNGFENVYLIKNDSNIDLKPILDKLISKTYVKNEKYFENNTTKLEVELFNRICNDN